MKKSGQLFTLTQVLSSIVMLVLLLWLTVCLPIVNGSQKATKAQTEQKGKESKSDDSNPLSNSNEEKSENGASLLSEYIHEIPVLERHFIILTNAFKGHPSALYIAYHPDLIIPPPEA